MNPVRPATTDEEVQAALRALLTPRCVLLGVGNRRRGDDGFGPAVVAHLRGKTTVPLYDGGVAPENYVERVARHAPECVVLIDAADLGALPGTLRLCRPADLGVGGVSTHAGSLALLAQYWQTACGARTILLAAQPSYLGATPAPRLSRPLRAALARASRALLAALHDVTALPGTAHVRD